jgi:hypothetical protein
MVKRIPKAGSTLTRGLFGKVKSFSKVKKIKEDVLAYLIEIIPWSKLDSEYLSFDSKVLVRYGNQSGAKKGYNHKKKGRKSHHPLVVFLNKSKYVLGVLNRAGNKKSGEGVSKLFRDTYLKIKDKVKITGVLADSGFYKIDFVKSIEEQGLEYIISAVISPIIQQEIMKVKGWRNVTKGIDVSSFSFQHKDDKWDKDRLYIVVRQEKKVLESPKGKQLSLFEDFEELNRFRYSCYITNKEGEPVDIWREYRPRANDENTLKELQDDFGFDTFCMKKFWSTEFSMVIRVLLYNIFNLFRNEILVTRDNPAKETLSTIRFKYLIIPGSMSFPSRIPTLTMNVVSKKLRHRIVYLITKVNQYVAGFKINCNAVEGSNVK